MDAKTVQAIEAIIKRGNDAEKSSVAGSFYFGKRRNE